MHLKVFVKLKKNLKTLSSGQKNPKKPKKNHWAGFFKKKPGFFQPCEIPDTTEVLIFTGIFTNTDLRYGIIKEEKNPSTYCTYSVYGTRVAIILTVMKVTSEVKLGMFFLVSHF